MLTRSPSFLTLTEDDFHEACRRLAEAARDSEPDLIVGIATGGVHVAEAMRSHFDTDPRTVVVRMGRPATAVKQRLRTDIILGRLPQRVAYLLRWLEVAARERMLRKDSPANESHAEVASSGGEGALASARRVLVVDDTIDSGRTLQAAVRTVRKHNPDCEVRTAALASTWRNPPVSPEYLLHPRTLVRFHWSLDVRT